MFIIKSYLNMFRAPLF